MIVMKFGGTSLESAEAIDRLVSIVKARLERRPVVVVSAMGKTTNRLLAAAQAAVSGDRGRAMKELADLEAYTLAEGKEPADPIRALFHELAELVQGLAILGELTPRSIDAIGAVGEALSSLVVTEALRRQGISAAHIDSREVIVTDSRHTQASPLYPETYRRIREKVAPLAARQVVVMGGFIASNASGVTTTLGRGGSDFSAAILGAGLDAEEIQIWTDVDGMLTCDPRILPGGHRVRTISFTEAAELAYFGAKVLHPSTVLPAIEKNIPVHILNSRRPEAEGTRIVSESVRSKNPIKSIACKRGITAVNIKSTRMLMAHGFLRRIFEVFDRYETAVDMVTTSEVSVSLTIDDARSLEAIGHDLSEFAEVSVEENLAIVALVGDRLGAVLDIPARSFGALAGVKVRMISQGASRMNLSIVVADQDLQRTVAALHGEYFSDLDPAVFERAA
jgi:aspartate kinase